MGIVFELATPMLESVSQEHVAVYYEDEVGVELLEGGFGFWGEILARLTLQRQFVLGELIPYFIIGIVWVNGIVVGKHMRSVAERAKCPLNACVEVVKLRSYDQCLWQVECGEFRVKNEEWRVTYRYYSEALHILEIGCCILHMLTTLFLVGQLHVVTVDISEALVDILRGKDSQPFELNLLQRIEIVGIVGFAIAVGLGSRTQTLCILGQAAPNGLEEHILDGIPEVTDNVVEIELRIVKEEVVGKRTSTHNIPPRLVCHLGLLDELEDIDEDTLVTGTTKILKVKDKEGVIVADTQISATYFRSRIALTCLQEIVALQFGLGNLDELPVILARHIHVEIIIPWDELALVALVAKECSVVYPIAQIVFAADTVDFGKHSNSSKLNLAKVRTFFTVLVEILHVLHPEFLSFFLDCNLLTRGIALQDFIQF